MHDILEDCQFYNDLTVGKSSSHENVYAIKLKSRRSTVNRGRSLVLMIFELKDTPNFKILWSNSVREKRDD